MMKHIISPIGARVPETSAKPKRPITPESIIKWRSKLPIVDTGETAKKIYQALVEVLQTPMSAYSRYKIMELFRPPIKLICLELKKHYINRPINLSKDSVTLSNLAQTLQSLMADGYKLVLHQLIVDDLLDKENDLAIIAIQRVFFYFNFILLRCYQIYSPAPEYLWQEMHVLYKLAADSNLVDKTITDTEATAEEVREVNLTRTYLKPVVLAATDPYQWRRNEQEHLSNAINHWVEYTVLTESHPDGGKNPGIYIIDLAKDLPPYPQSLDIITHSETTKAFSMLALVDHLEKMTSNFDSDELGSRIIQSGNVELSVSRSIVKRLIKNWSNIRKREYNRFPQTGKMRITFGLSATHYYISGKKHFQSHYDEDELDKDITDTLDEGNKKLEANAYSVYECDLVNISPAGMCLKWSGSSYSQIQAGEIIGLQSTIDLANNPWSIGVIRWLKYSKEQELMIGIHLLAPYARASGVQLFKHLQAAGYYLRCLMLPEMESMGLKATIVTPTLPFKKGSDFSLIKTDKADERLAGTLTKLIDETDSYKQFEYDINNKIKQSNTNSDEDEININILPPGTDKPADSN